MTIDEKFFYIFLPITLISTLSAPFYPKTALVIMIIFSLFSVYTSYKLIKSNDDSGFYRKKSYLFVLMASAIISNFFLTFNGHIINIDNFWSLSIDDGSTFYINFIIKLIPQLLFLAIAFVVISFSFDFINKAERLLGSVTALKDIKKEILENNQHNLPENMTYSIIDELLINATKAGANLKKSNLSTKEISIFYKNINTYMLEMSKNIEKSSFNKDYDQHVKHIKMYVRNKHLVSEINRVKEYSSLLTTFSAYSKIVSKIINEFKDYQGDKIKFFTTYSSPINTWFAMINNRKDYLLASEWKEYIELLSKAVNEENVKLERALLYIREEGEIGDEKASDFFKNGKLNDNVISNDNLKKYYEQYHSLCQLTEEREAFLVDIDKNQLDAYMGEHSLFLRDFFVVCDQEKNQPLFALGIANTSSKNLYFELFVVDFTDNYHDSKYEKFIKKFMKDYFMEDLYKKNLMDIYPCLQRS